VCCGQNGNDAETSERTGSSDGSTAQTREVVAVGMSHLLDQPSGVSKISRHATEHALPKRNVGKKEDFRESMVVRALLAASAIANAFTSGDIAYFAIRAAVAGALRLD
jgi:hypothetical protein